LLPKTFIISYFFTLSRARPSRYCGSIIRKPHDFVIDKGGDMGFDFNAFPFKFRYHPPKIKPAVRYQDRNAFERGGVGAFAVIDAVMVIAGFIIPGQGVRVHGPVVNQLKADNIVAVAKPDDKLHGWIKKPSAPGFTLGLLDVINFMQGEWVL